MMGSKLSLANFNITEIEISDSKVMTAADVEVLAFYDGHNLEYYPDRLRCWVVKIEDNLFAVLSWDQYSSEQVARIEETDNDAQSVLNSYGQTGDIGACEVLEQQLETGVVWITGKAPIEQKSQCDIFTIKTVIEVPGIGDDVRGFMEDHTRSTDRIATMMASGYQVVGVQIFKQLETFGIRTLEATVRYTTLALYPSKPQSSDAVLPKTTEGSNNG